ncbi:acetylornithine transaminase [Candidatus Methylospira mobilis]|uniref:Acetylornithine aminotransferase n=1 Tax=Candidatus Methylospira mobilis TaxID=1808979 RepID=A0A5Q0BHX6_9GAMM|nr:acetylornithine transaminase [Candidatus Methylospira mobilis]QFY43423.1 acetylornithine transaminase [Candidatus Methylospira mobilis]
MNDHIMPTYARLPVVFERGEGAWLWDNHGKTYLDALSGISVCNLGHAHPAITKAIAEQAAKLVHTSNLYRVALQEELADQLCAASRMENVFFCNSGAEANEAAIKLARRYGHQKGIDAPAIVVMEGSFHGRTLATLSATGNPKVQEGFEPLVSGFLRAPYDDIQALEELTDPDIVAVLVEPIQGEGGVRIPQPDYLSRLRELCDQRGWLLILDEVQSGMGRTGKLFAFQHAGILPDAFTLAKALGNGVPIGACLAQGVAASVLTPGKHGSTFGGNPLACSAALAVLKTLRKEKLVGRAGALGDSLASGLRSALSGNPHVREVRNKGMMIGIELDQACPQLIVQALNQGLLINVTADKVIRLLPPFILKVEEAQVLIEKLAGLINHAFTAHTA